MKAIIQRVTEAEVTVDNTTTGKIEKGLLLLVGFEPGDEFIDLQKIAQKIIQLRIFNDAAGKMNLSIIDIGGDILSVSQFTLYADIRKGNRPSFTGAAPAALANELYEKFIKILSQALGKPVKNGIFGAYMRVQLVNDGPVTIILNSHEL